MKEHREVKLSCVYVVGKCAYSYTGQAIAYENVVEKVYVLFHNVFCVNQGSVKSESKLHMVERKSIYYALIKVKSVSSFTFR